MACTGLQCADIDAHRNLKRYECMAQVVRDAKLAGRDRRGGAHRANNLDGRRVMNAAFAVVILPENST